MLKETLGNYQSPKFEEDVVEVQNPLKTNLKSEEFKEQSSDSSV